MMELNAKTPFLWDLESLVMFSTKTGETPKTLQLVDSEIEGIEGFEVGPFYSSGGRSDGGMGSDLGYASSWRSSKSASDDSSTDKDIKETQFSLETNDCFQPDLRRKGDFVTFEPTRMSPTIESSAVSGESFTALGLCNRTYFEDISVASNLKNTTQTSLPRDSSAKKSKSSSLGLDISRCQVEGCDVDLSSAKDYHRKHKVCESHSKSPRVVIKGHERRFCQQCSRFHGISEFDQKKRSCRRRLSDHNARRRKPKPEVQFNSTLRLACSLYEGRNQLNSGFDQLPVAQTRNATWEGTIDTKPTLTKPNLFTAKVFPVSNHFSPAKGTPPEVYQRGLQNSVAPCYPEAAQEFRALSLLSTSSWGSYDPNPSTLDQTVHLNNPSLAQPLPAMDAVPLGGPPVSSEFWIAEPPAAVSHTPSFQLFKAPNESSFYPY